MRITELRIFVRRHVPHAKELTHAELQAAVLAGFMHALTSVENARTHIRREYEVGIMVNGGVPG